GETILHSVCMSAILSDWITCLTRYSKTARASAKRANSCLNSDWPLLNSPGRLRNTACASYRVSRASKSPRCMYSSKRRQIACGVLAGNEKLELLGARVKPLGPDVTGGHAALLQILLVIILSLVKRDCRHDLGNDGFAETARFA